MKATSRILIADDDTDICYLLEGYLQSNGYEVETAFSASTALAKLRKEKFDLMLCDFRLPDMDGLETLKEVRKISSDIQVIIITGYSDVSIAVKSIKLGAFEYVTKPIYHEEILHKIEEALSKGRTSSEPAKAGGSGKNKVPTFKYINGESQQSKSLEQLIDLVAPTDMTCLILGESGTGKEYVARRLHEKSARSKNPFVAVDCGALSQDIAATELFGHVKGAFTGAIKDNSGHFESANGGTLFLDEIGNLTHENQMKLLRVIQERKVRKVGGQKDQPVDVRLVVATNDDLRESVLNGDFRDDLFHRINEFKLEVSPLRERQEDIEKYSNAFLRQANEQLSKNVKKISGEVRKLFLNHYWPGNLRELQNVIKRAVLMEQGTEISAASIPEDFAIKPQESWQSDLKNGVVMELSEAVEQTERKAIRNALMKANYNKSKTAELLGIDRKTLYNKINQYNLDS